jgi:hypothetical protein
LFNPCYQFGCYLQAYVNDKAISVDKMRPVFRVVQSLYNHAIEKIGMMDLLDEKGVNVNVEQINYNRVDGNAIATIAYCKVDKELLRMTPPDNDYDPYVYINKAQIFCIEFLIVILLIVLIVSSNLLLIYYSYLN